MTRKLKSAPGLLTPISSTLPWSCTHFGDQSEIEAFVKGRWETVADVHSVGDIDAEDIADYIIRAVEAFRQKLENQDAAD